MSFLFLLAVAGADQLIVFTRYESREPTTAQMQAYEDGEKLKLTKLLPVVDRVELRLRDGETERFAGSQMNGYASLEVDRMGYFLRFDTGKFHHKSQMLIEKCQPVVFYRVRGRVNGKYKLVAESVTLGEGC